MSNDVDVVTRFCTHVSYTCVKLDMTLLRGCSAMTKFKWICLDIFIFIQSNEFFIRASLWLVLVID